MHELSEIERNARLAAADDRPGDEIWKLHHLGYAPSDIAKYTGKDADAVRAHVSGLWLKDKERALARRRYAD